MFWTMSKESNPVLDWINNDQKLKAIIKRLSNSGLSEPEQADIAFDEITDAYDLPKYPDSFSQDDYEKYDTEGIDNPRSVFEEVGIIHYLEPNDDPRGIVLFAIYNIKNRTYMPMDEPASRHFKTKEKIPPEYIIYYLGDRSETMLYFLEKNESWSEKGAKYASKIIKVH